MTKVKHAINWFEIPAANYERALRFYGTILGEDVKRVEMPGARMGFLPADPGAVGGAIIEAENYVPSSQGTLLYLNGGADLSQILNRVEGAGGKVEMPKTKAGDYGFVGRFRDTEGNLVALHSYT